MSLSTKTVEARHRGLHEDAILALTGIGSACVSQEIEERHKNAGPTRHSVTNLSPKSMCFPPRRRGSCSYIGVPVLPRTLRSITDMLAKRKNKSRNPIPQRRNHPIVNGNICNRRPNCCRSIQNLGFSVGGCGMSSLCEQIMLPTKSDHAPPHSGIQGRLRVV